MLQIYQISMWCWQTLIFLPTWQGALIDKLSPNVERIARARGFKFKLFEKKIN